MGWTYVFTLVGLFLDASRAFPQVALNKANCAVALLADVVNVGFSAAITMEGDSKVFCLINIAMCCPVDGVRGCSHDVFPII